MLPLPPTPTPKKKPKHLDNLIVQKGYLDM